MANNSEDKWLFIGVAVIAIFIALSVVSYFWLGPMIFTEQREAGAETVEQTYNAENAIQEYEWFREQYQDIEAQRSQIENTQDELKRFYDIHGKDPDEWSRIAAEDHSRIQQRLTGNQNQLESMVAEYNARSNSANRALFKCNLPYQVDDQFYITGPPGSEDAEQPQDVGIDGEQIDGEPAPAEECGGLPDNIETN